MIFQKSIVIWIRFYVTLLVVQRRQLVCLLHRLIRMIVGKQFKNTKDFWANLDWMPGAKRLYSFIQKYDTNILSAYSDRDSNSRSGKLKWLGKNTKIKRGNINLVKRADKQKYATTDGKPNILIDDYKKNIVEWESKGGIGVYHTEVGKTIAELKRLGFK
jgi:hypothetical protein